MPKAAGKNTRPLAGVVYLTGIIEKEDDQFVSYCRELGTSSCGDTVDEAVRNLGDAIEVHIDALIETGELLRVLRERNIRIDLQPPLDEVSTKVAPGKIFTIYQQEVPIDEAARA
ncbi:MAG: type II toxin-antitoxin system HicB family antitoxin [Chloroflexi bacterium]|nr:type II toxin-antitoxin system HicB family antitoxin [Chloroflexota bacterium]